MEKGNACFIENSKTLWLIIEVKGNSVKLKNLKTQNIQIVSKNQITEIVEN